MQPPLKDIVADEPATGWPEDGTPAWLYAADTDRILWRNDAAHAFGPDRAVGPIHRAGLARLGAIARDAPRATPSLERLRLPWLPGAGLVTCRCLAVILTSGETGVLLQAQGLRAARRTPAVETPPDGMPAEEAPLVVASVPVENEPAPIETPIPKTTTTWRDLPEGGRRPLRFVWQTDLEGRFVHVSRELTEAVGPGNGIVVGRTAAELARDLGVDGTSLAERLALRTTWSGLTLDWPSDARDWIVPVELAGVPVETVDGFEGYRGYGICRTDLARQTEPSSAEEPILAAPDAPEPEAPEAYPASAPDAATDEGPEDDSPAGLDAEMAPEPEPTQAFSPPTSATVEEPEAAIEGPQVEAPEDASAEVSIEPAVDIQTSGAVADESVGSAPSGKPALPDAGPPATPTVVPLHPSAGAEQRSGLSQSEHNAFREIAKALGARFEGERTPAGITPRDNGNANGSGTVPSPPQRPDQGPPSPRPAIPKLPVEPALRLVRTMPVDPLASAAPRLLDQIPTGVLVLAGEDPVFANRTLLDLLGYDDFASFRDDGGLGRLFRGRVPPGQGVLDGQTFTISRRGGDILLVEAVQQATEWNGAPATLFAFRKAADGSQSPRARALELDVMAAKAQLRELKFVLDTATDGVVSLDEQGRILGLNRSAEALFGLDQNEVAGERFTTLFAPESHGAALDYLEGLRANGVASVLNDGREVLGRERNGGRIPLFMTIGRVGETAGGKFCAVLRDITQWKKAEADLTEAKRVAERASAQKSDVLARISHEIRTPLNAVIGFAEVMMEERFGPIGVPRYLEYLRDIHTSGTHVIALINDLLDLAKIEAGRLELAFTSVDVNDIVASSIAIMQPQASSARVIVRSQLAARLPPVVADSRSLRQIVLNILSNAAKFTEPGGQIIVSTALTERGEVAVRVRDTGIGMSESDITAAMEPFRQVPGAKAKGGTGLGLPLTKALVEANRAAFTLRSRPSEGTLVEVIFPPTRVLAE